MPEQQKLFRLRLDLRITAGDEGGFIVEDARRGQYFRVGPREYAVLAQLDGATALADAVQRAGTDGESSPLTVAAVETWLASTSLVEAADARSEIAPLNRVQPTTKGRLNPCYFRFPLPVPEQLQSRLEHALGWLTTRGAIAVALCLTIVAALLLAQEWIAFSASLNRVLCPDQHLPLLGCWLILKVAHELGHGVTCRRLGGEVREWGLAFIYLMPVPYTDVTSSWRFSSRWDRMAVAAAGMYFEWLSALIAFAVWWFVDDVMVRQWCAYMISLATITTILFNANPLCRMDGYYLLSDLLGWPNLAGEGQKRATELLRRLAGVPVALEPVSSRSRYWLALAYGLASLVWRQTALVTMALVVLWAYEGFGAIMIAVVLAMWFWPREHASAASDRKQSIWLRGPVMLRLAGGAGVLAVLSWYLPWPATISAPGVFESIERHVVRARSAGQVREILVRDGDVVQAGVKLAVLQNEELLQELNQLEQSFAQGEARLRSLHTRRQLVDFQVEQQRQESLAAQIAESKRKLESLTLVAPISGRVTARRLADLSGSYLAEGAEFCTIQGDTLQFRFSLAEDKLARVTRSQGKPLSIRVAGKRVAGTLSQLEPQASTALVSEALGAGAGGPLAVVPPDSKPTKESTPQAWKLVEPRITGIARLDSFDADIRNGQLGFATFAAERQTMAQVIAGWCRRRFFGQ